MPEKRVVPERDPQPSGNIVLQVPDKHIQTPAIRALVIPVLNECVGSILRTMCVVQGANRKQEVLDGIHRCESWQLIYRCRKHGIGFNWGLPIR